MLSKGVPRHVSATRASRFVRCRSAQQGKQYALLRVSSSQATLCRHATLFRRITPVSFSTGHPRSTKPAILMLQTTRIWLKCAPALARFTSNPTQSRRSFAPELPTWPKVSRFLVNSLPFVDRGAILGPISAASPRPRTSINARNNDEWNPASGFRYCRHPGHNLRLHVHVPARRPSDWRRPVLLHSHACAAPSSV